MKRVLYLDFGFYSDYLQEMLEDLGEPISVVTFYNSQTSLSVPKQIVWRGRQYSIDRVGLRHCFWRGKSLVHIFSVVSGENFIRLRLETDKLEWFIDSFGEA